MISPTRSAATPPNGLLYPRACRVERTAGRPLTLEYDRIPCWRAETERERTAVRELPASEREVLEPLLPSPLAASLCAVVQTNPKKTKLVTTKERPIMFCPPG